MSENEVPSDRDGPSDERQASPMTPTARGYGLSGPIGVTIWEMTFFNSDGRRTRITLYYPPILRSAE